MPENTSRRDPLIHVAGSWDNPSRYIEEMEADGQRQLVNGTDLPAKGYDVKEFEAVGFTFGEPDKRDPLFRPATLPEGWKREGSDHSMWSYIVDQLGRRRVSIFYKAAFYDRDANMRLETRYGYLRRVVDDNAEPVLDDVWLPREVALATLDNIHARCLKDATDADDLAGHGDRDGYWVGRAGEHRADAEKVAAVRSRIAADAGAVA